MPTINIQELTLHINQVNIGDNQEHSNYIKDCCACKQHSHRLLSELISLKEHVNCLEVLLCTLKNAPNSK
jgi:hypothetical protein